MRDGEPRRIVPALVYDRVLTSRRYAALRLWARSKCHGILSADLVSLLLSGMEFSSYIENDVLSLIKQGLKLLNSAFWAKIFQNTIYGVARVRWTKYCGMLHL